MNLYLLKVAFCVLYLVSSASAQRAARMIYFNAPDDAPKKTFLYQQKDSVAKELELKSKNFAAAFKLESGDLNLRFLPAPLAVDQEIPSKAPAVRIPKEWDKVLLLVSEDKNNSVIPIRVVAINASDNVFPEGSLYFINLSNVYVQGTLGDQTLQMKPRSKKIITSPRKDVGNYGIKVESYNENTKQKSSLVEQLWRHIPTSKFVVIITNLPPPRSAKLFTAEIRNFDIPEEEEDQEGGE